MSERTLEGLQAVWSVWAPRFKGGPSDEFSNDLRMRAVGFASEEQAMIWATSELPDSEYLEFRKIWRRERMAGLVVVL